MKHIYYLSILCLVSIMFACESTIRFDINADNLLVVNSVISPFDSINVNISRSVDIDGVDTIKTLNDAIVSIYAENEFTECLNYFGDGNYKSSFIPKAGINYKIEVVGDGLKYVKSTTTIPLLPVIAAVEVDSTNNYYHGNCYRLKITIDDDASIDNFYYLTLTGYNRKYQNVYNDSLGYYVGEHYEVYTDLLFSYANQYLLDEQQSSASDILDAIIGSSDAGAFTTEKAIFSDRGINGMKYSFYIIIVAFINLSEEKPITIHLKSINKDYYNYLKSKTKDKNNLLNEPTKVYNNIDDGAGIFCGYNETTYEITGYTK